MLYKLIQYRLFDLIFGVNTSEPVSNSELDIDPAVRAHITSYMPTTLTQMMWSVWALKTMYPANFKPEEWHLFDLGSGQGRVCFFGAALGFHRVTGIELSEGLHRSALENLANARFCPKSKIEFILGDCREFKVTHKKTLFFLFNPFDIEMLEVILRKVRDARNQGAEVILAYINCPHLPLVRPYFEASRTFGRNDRSAIFW